MHARIQRFALTTLCLFAALVLPARAQSTAFTYQGKLAQSGVAANGLFHFRYTFYSVREGGTATSPTACADDVAVSDGLVTVIVALTPPAGSNTYVEIQTRPGGEGAFHLAGLVALTHTPSPMGFLSAVLERPAHERPFLLLPVGYPATGCTVPDLRRKNLDEILIIPHDTSDAARLRRGIFQSGQPSHGLAIGLKQA
ncbi:MAG: hypothetical protein IT433_12150 [Phycisphaerales bacterium]|nr:hypothetical protein [Phycisphaerales bacterium]